MCEAEEGACKRNAQALCYHCSKNLCRIHLVQHAQLIEDITRASLNSLADKFNELSSKFDHISISDNILKKPFVQLEQWRKEAHEKIDRIVEETCQKLNSEIDKYRNIFLKKTEEQLKEMSTSKRMIAPLMQESDASAKQIADLQASIDKAEQYLNSVIKHEINVIDKTLIWFVDIDTNFLDFQCLADEELRELKITYVRLNGIIRNYYVNTRKDGNIDDLKNSFVQKYKWQKEFSQLKHSSTNTTDHCPKSDFILAVEVYNHRIHLQYSDKALLTNILDRDLIVFYETPYSLNEENNSYILMPCYFQRLPDKKPFALPIYLSVPRTKCRGQHIFDSLCNSLGKYFPLNSNTDRHLYDVHLEIKAADMLNRTKLIDVLQDEMDFTKQSTTLVVEINKQTADTYERDILKQLGY